MTTSQVSTKVRFVRCPKCRNILAELPQVPLYKCGGCGAILQAKNLRMEMNHTEVASQVIDADANTRNDNVAEEEEAMSSNRDTSYPATELSPNKNDVNHEDFNEFPGSSEEKVSTTEDTPKQDDINQNVSRDQNEGDKSERALQEVDNFQNPPKLKNKENENFPLEKDKTTQNLLADQDKSFYGEITRGGIDSSYLEVVSNTNDNPTPPQSALKRSITPVDPLSHDNDIHFVHPHESVSSVDTMGSSMPVDRSFHLGVKHGHDLTNSPTTSSYYAYDGSESAYDDYRIQQHVPHSSRRKINNVDPTSARELPLRTTFRLNSDHEMNYRRRPNPSSILHERRHHSMRGLKWTHDEGKMELLRTVCELKDQLDQIQFPKFAPNARVPTRFVNQRYSAHYYDRLEPELEIYAHSNWNPRRAERYNGHRVAFSGEAAHYRHHVNSSFSNRYPRERYHSAQLPSHSTHNYSIPQQYSSSEISLKLDKQRQRDDEIKRLYLKEKYHTEKRLVRPMAGASPFFTCYHCFRLLELPEDFLVVDKKCHQVRCNACGKVMKLSLVERAHLVPFLYQSKNKSLTGNIESAGPASKERKMRKPTSEMEERTSALHWLMGYESPSQVYD